MKIRILFYKARLGDKHWLDDAISLWTWPWNIGTGPYSHVELWIPDEQIGFGMKQFEISDEKMTHFRIHGGLDEGLNRLGLLGWYREATTGDGEARVFTENIYGTCYTSTMRGKTKGVVKRSASKVLKNPDRWDVCEIEIGDDRVGYLMDFLEYWVQYNEGYDFKAVLSFFWFKRVHKFRKWICSEFVHEALQYARAGVLTGGYKCPSPRRLSRWLTKKSYEIKPLTKGT